MSTEDEATKDDAAEAEPNERVRIVIGKDAGQSRRTVRCPCGCGTQW